MLMQSMLTLEHKRDFEDKKGDLIALIVTVMITQMIGVIRKMDFLPITNLKVKVEEVIMPLEVMETCHLLATFMQVAEVLASEHGKQMHQRNTPVMQPISSDNNSVSGLSADQFDKLVYLLNNAQIQSTTTGGGSKLTFTQPVTSQVMSLKTANDTVAGKIVHALTLSKPVINQIMKYLTVCSNVTGKFIHPLSTFWILDSGASDHIVCSTAYFSRSLPVLHMFVQLPNNVTVPVTHKGTVQFNSCIILKDVLCAIF